jgi:peptide-methionine (S)-S-oxide reductase
MDNANKEQATLAGGCFWCLEAVFEQLRGVEKVESGYSGGHTVNPTYYDVCSETTGHAECVQLTFDPKVITFKQLLEVFFTLHDPTTLNRQGPDVGTSYRSAVFYRGPEQKAVTDQVIADFEKKRVWNGRIVTEVAPFKAFYPAEEYHREYYRRNPDQMYCRLIIDPKIAKLRKQFFEMLKK